MATATGSISEYSSRGIVGLLKREKWDKERLLRPGNSEERVMRVYSCGDPQQSLLQYNPYQARVWSVRIASTALVASVLAAAAWYFWTDRHPVRRECERSAVEYGDNCSDHDFVCFGRPESTDCVNAGTGCFDKEYHFIHCALKNLTECCQTVCDCTSRHIERNFLQFCACVFIETTTGDDWKNIALAAAAVAGPIIAFVLVITLGEVVAERLILRKRAPEYQRQIRCIDGAVTALESQQGLDSSVIFPLLLRAELRKSTRERIAMEMKISHILQNYDFLNDCLTESQKRALTIVQEQSPEALLTLKEWMKKDKNLWFEVVQAYQANENYDEDLVTIGKELGILDDDATKEVLREEVEFGQVKIQRLKLLRYPELAREQRPKSAPTHKLKEGIGLLLEFIDTREVQNLNPDSLCSLMKEADRFKIMDCLVYCLLFIMENKDSFVQAELEGLLSELPNFGPTIGALLAKTKAPDVVVEADEEVPLLPLQSQ